MATGGLQLLDCPRSQMSLGPGPHKPSQINLNGNDHLGCGIRLGHPHTPSMTPAEASLPYFRFHTQFRSRLFEIQPANLWIFKQLTLVQRTICNIRAKDFYFGKSIFNINVHAWNGIIDLAIGFRDHIMSPLPSHHCHHPAATKLSNIKTEALLTCEYCDIVREKVWPSNMAKEWSTHNVTVIIQ